MAKDHLTQSEFARVLGASRQVVYMKVRRGVIKTVEDDSGVRVIPMTEAKKWLARREAQIRGEMDEIAAMRRRLKELS